MLTVVALLAAVVFAIAAPPAGAATPCWKRLINDWYDGRIDGAYPVACYHAAIDNLPEDVAIYASAREDIERELLAAISRNGGVEPDLVEPSGNPDSGRDGEGSGAGGGGSNDDDDDGGVFGQVLDELGPSNADSIPLPLLILAGLGLLLLAAAAVSYGARRLQAHRARVTPTPGSRSQP
jgi:hypothetical protein